MPRLAIAMNMLAPYWIDVFDRLADCGWDIRVIVGIEKEPACHYDMQAKVPGRFSVKLCATLAFNQKRWSGRAEYLHFPFGLWRELRVWQPDVVLSSELGLRTLISRLYGMTHRIPVIPWVCLSPHSERHKSRLRVGFRRLLIGNAKHVCTNMSEAEQYLTSRLGVNPEAIFYTPYTIDVVKRSRQVAGFLRFSGTLRAELGLEGTVFLYVGSMIPRKGLQELAHGLRHLAPFQRERCSFLFIGGELPAAVREQLDKADIRHVALPFVQPHDLPRYYAAADAFIFPSLEDEWGIVLNEAAAAGLPLIASRYAAATAELVLPGENGLRFDPYDSHEVAACIAQLLDLPEQRRQEWGRKSVEIAGRIGIDFTVGNLDRALRSASGLSVAKGGTTSLNMAARHD